MEKRRTFAITFNKGLDKSSLPFEADPARALDEINYVYRDGKVQKRFGFNQLLQAPATHYRVVGFDGTLTDEYKTNTTEFNGIWEFVAEDGDRHIIAHIGKLLYEISEGDGESWHAEPLKTSSSNYTHNGVLHCPCFEFVSYKSTAVIGRKSLYFLGGNKLMRLRFTEDDGAILSPVEDDEDTYVPTTTISIAEDGSSLGQRASLDQVNLLTQMRVNKLVGGTIPQTDSPSVHSFVLDSPIVSKDENPEPLISVYAEASTAGWYDSSALDPLTGPENIPVLPVPNGANWVEAEIVGENGEAINAFSISPGEPTRAEVLLRNNYGTAKVFIRFYDRTVISTVDGNVENKDLLSTRQYDMNTFIENSLVSNDFAVVWASGASLSSYDGSGDTDTLRIYANKTGVYGPMTTIPTNVNEVLDTVSATMKCVALDDDIDIEITNGSTKTTVPDVSALLIDQSDEGAWVDNLTGTVSMAGERLYATQGSTNVVYGVVKNAGDETKNGEIILFGDWRQRLGTYTNNIEVLYPCYIEGNADRIDKCRIAKLFGNANAKNRLFVSGNPDFPNCDWHSSARSDGDGESNGDFTYFGDLDFCFYGQDSNAVMGYDCVATDRMVVIKSKSKVEPTNYFRTSTLIQAISPSGNSLNDFDGSSLYQEAFPLQTGNIGSGAMNMRSIANLNGDTVYLSSENSICGLDIVGQVGDSQRIAYSRSRRIDPELRELNLTNATLWTDNSSLFLFADEATYMTHYDTFNPETAQYEWFKMDVNGVRCAIEIDGVMVVGTADGSLLRFEKGLFADISKLYLNVGATLWSNGYVTYNSAYNGWMAKGRGTLSMRQMPESLDTSMFRRVASISDASGNGVDLVIDSEDTTKFRIVAIDSDGIYDLDRHMELVGDLAREVDFYLNHPQGEEEIDCEEDSPLGEYYVPYRVQPTNEAADTYRLLDSDGNAVDLADLHNADLCLVLSGDVAIIGLDTANSKFRLSDNGRAIEVELYGEQTSADLSIKVEIHRRESVKAFFIAAPAPLGDISYRKTIWAWTLSAFKEPNDLSVCQATNDEDMEDMRKLEFADSIPIGVDLRSLSFSAFDLQKSVVPRKYTYFRPISVAFVAFGFFSTEEANSILTATSIVYTIPMLSRGDK